MLRHLRPAIVVLALATVVTGVAYPLAVTAIAQVAFSAEADGSEIVVDGAVVGSALVAQPFAGDQWFHPRPSAVDHSAATSSGSNLGPTSPELLAQVAERAETYRQDNRLPAGILVPVDAVTASGSGLDPHISIRNARLQVTRVASVRGLDADVVRALVDDHVERRTFGVLGEARVNVVELNAALVAVET